ncbi:hypothetical protein [Thorsellia anophelis]|uniref:AsmA family protein n=1 Tax=Thorsellia anophelis DSM 18579 TaxID=1123402 RepID=A0A1I0E5Z1_9GAMM|nr:hypothetical protein [Thorsellia anophelis]SET40063.1 hypothetical protein SAMN02583745_02244 [Thorsellia anophelis DSM 18579]
MRFYTKASIIVLTLILVSILFLYAMPQTKQLGPLFAKIVSSHAGYQVKFTDVQHSFSQKDTLTVNNVEIKSNSGDIILSAEKLVLRIKNWTQISDNLDFKLIYVENGIINVDKIINETSIKSDSLQLKNIRATTNVNGLKIQATGLTAQVSPWNNNEYNWLLHDNDLALSAKTIRVFPSSDSLSNEFQIDGILNNIRSTLGDRFEFKNIILKSKRLEDVIFINELGLDWLEGSITAKARIQPQKKWFFDYLYIDNITHHINLSIDEIINSIKPTYVFKQATFTNSTLSGKDWNLENVYIDLKNLEFDSNQLQGMNNEEKPTGDISLTADKLTCRDLNLDDANLILSLKDNAWSIKQASANLLEGYIATTGHYDIIENSLILDSMVANNFNLNLQSLPEELLVFTQALTRVKVLTISTLQLKNISIHSIQDFLPWQIKNITLDGKSLKIIDNYNKGFHSGYFSSVINDLSINSIDFSIGASFQVLADKSKILVHALKAATDKGVIEIPSISIDRQKPANLKFNLNAQSIDRSIFERWYWPKLPLSHAQGDLVNFELEANGIIPDNLSNTLSQLSTQKRSELTFNLVNSLQLSGVLSVSNTAEHGLSDLRYSLTQTLLNGEVIETNYQEQPSVNHLKELLVINQNANLSQKLAMQAQIEKQIYDQIDLLFGEYETILNTKIEQKLNKLRTAPFFESQSD